MKALGLIVASVLLLGCAAAGPAAPAGERRVDFSDPSARFEAYRDAVPALSAPIPEALRPLFDAQCRTVIGSAASRSVALNADRGLVCINVPLPLQAAQVICSQLGYADGVPEENLLVCRGPLNGRRESTAQPPAGPGA